MSNGPTVVSKGRRRERSAKSSWACWMSSRWTAKTSGRFFCGSGVAGPEDVLSSTRSWKFSRPRLSIDTCAWKRTSWTSFSASSRRMMRQSDRFTYSRSQETNAPPSCAFTRRSSMSMVTERA